MAIDLFLKIDGIQGESTDAKHADEIDILCILGASRSRQ
jgi:type VI protein secretion system component Hcp